MVPHDSKSDLPLGDKNSNAISWKLVGSGIIFLWLLLRFDVFLNKLRFEKTISVH